MSRLALKLAIALLPPGRRAWGEAMRGEYEHLSENQSAFAFGCLESSLKENVTTGDGWARIGFGLVLLISLWLAGYWTYWTLSELFEISSQFSLKFFWTLATMGFVCYPIVLGMAAQKALKAPLDRFQLAEIGYRMTFQCLIIAGGMQALLSVISLVSIMVAKARHEQLETSLSVGLVSAIFLLSVAWFARHNARMTRNAAALALLLCATFYGLIQVLMPSLTDNSGHDWRFTIIVIGLLMLLTMIASALFVWMQRPARGAA